MHEINVFDYEEHILWKKNEEWQLFTGIKPLYANMLELVENGVWSQDLEKIRKMGFMVN